jgi:hypothetical protein
MFVLHDVQGRKSCCRTPDDVERIIRENHEQNISCFIVTDDNFARNSDWEVLFDRVIRLRETEFPDLVFTIQVDTLSHNIPNFIEKRHGRATTHPSTRARSFAGPRHAKRAGPR